MWEIFSHELNYMNTMKENKYRLLERRTSKRYRIVEHYPKDTLYPINIEIFPTNNCNLKCSFCAFHNRNLGNQIPGPIMARLVSEIINSSIRSVTLSGGGEPLLYPHIEDHIIDIAQTKDVGLITNGSVLTPSILEAMKQCSWVRFSLNGINQDDYQVKTGNNRYTFTKIINNIQTVSHLLNNTHTILGATFVVADIDESIQYYYHAIDLAKRLGLDQIIFRKNVSKVGEIAPIFNILEPALTNIIEYAHSQHIITNLIKVTSNEYKDNYNKPLGISCRWFDQYWKIFVNANGDTFSCINVLERSDVDSLGNIFRSSLLNILSTCKTRSSDFSCTQCRARATNSILNDLVHGKDVILPNDPHVNFI